MEGQKLNLESTSERVVGSALKGVEERSCMSRVSQRRALRDVSQKGSLVLLVGSGMKGRGKRGKRVWGETESNVRDVEKGRGWSKGGHQVHAALTATCVTPTAQHRQRCILTLAADTSPQTHHKTAFLARSPDNSLGNER